MVRVAVGLRYSYNHTSRFADFLAATGASLVGLRIARFGQFAVDGHGGCTGTVPARDRLRCHTPSISLERSMIPSASAALGVSAFCREAGSRPAVEAGRDGLAVVGPSEALLARGGGSS